jgi:hypothetical protein
LTAFVQGKWCAARWPPDLAVRKLAALEALSRSRRCHPMRWSISISRTCGRRPPSSTGACCCNARPSLARRDALLAEAQQICVRA